MPNDSIPPRINTDIRIVCSCFENGNPIFLVMGLSDRNNSLPPQSSIAKSYNLRSTQRKRNSSARNCYLQNFSENASPEAFNPKVCLKRLKFLEHHGTKNCSFFLEDGRIIVKPKKSVSSKKKFLLKLFCLVTVVITTLVFCHDYLKNSGIDLLETFAGNHSSIQNYYSAAVNLHWSIIKKLKYNQQKSMKKNTKPVVQFSKTSTLEQDSLEIRQLVRDYFTEIKKKKKIQNLGKSPQSFIEEQCKRDENNNSVIKKKKFFNVTYNDMANLTDYALESQGAKIVTVFNTELYGIITVKYLNISLWPELAHFLMKYLKCFSVNEPNSILMPWKKPGDCWAFKGSSGRVQIKLSEVIVITAVTIEHIPKEVSPRQNIQSAPKKFFLYGVEETGNEIKKTFLGGYQYEINGPAAQMFFIQPRSDVHFGIIEVVFESNHGNKIFTCIYKIRVHGYK